MSEKFPILTYLSEKRESVGKKKLDIDSLVLRSGSQDAAISIAAQNEIKRRWEIEPDKDARNAESVDLMEQFEKYTEKEKKRCFLSWWLCSLPMVAMATVHFVCLERKKELRENIFLNQSPLFLKNTNNFYPKV